MAQKRTAPTGWRKAVEDVVIWTTVLGGYVLLFYLIYLAGMWYRSLPRSHDLNTYYSDAARVWAVPAVGFLALYVARQQWLSTKERTRLDLFNKRFEVYLTVHRLLSKLEVGFEVITKADIDDAYRAWVTSQFLFKKYTPLLVKEVFEACDTKKVSTGDIAEWAASQKLSIYYEFEPYLDFTDTDRKKETVS